MKIYRIFCPALFFAGLSTSAQTPPTPPAAYSSSILINATRTLTPRSPIATEPAVISSSLTTQQVDQTTEYSDGFGRSLQTVEKQASPAGNDMVVLHVYDPIGRELYQYQSFTSNAATSGDVTNDGNLKSDPVQEQVSFYNTLLGAQPGETNVGGGGLNWAYSQTNYENSPMNRVLNTFSPGSGWVGGQVHNAKQALVVNTAADSVQIWNIPVWSSGSPETGVIPTNGGTYGVGTLYKTISTDEEGLQTIEFKDTYGQTLLRKIQLTAPADNGSGSGHPGWLCTYYVYDDYGNMRFIITPKAVQEIDGSWSINQTCSDELCYRFEYDLQKHLDVKKIPGTPTGSQGEIWMVYDERDRVVMQQDGNLRAQQKWEFIQYDNLDRPIETGLILDPTYYSNLNYHETQAAASGNTSTGVSAWPNLASYTGTEILSKPFYDGYTWMSAANSSTLSSALNTSGTGTGDTAFSSGYTTYPYAQPLTQSNKTQGLVTGLMTEVLGTTPNSKYEYAVDFYDNKSRIIQSQSINFSGGTDVATNQYSWDGKVLTTVVSHSKAGPLNPQTHTVTTHQSYDPEGRLLGITKYVSSVINGVALTTPVNQIATYTYDELGRLSNRNLAPYFTNPAGGKGMETLTYEYNPRGWSLGENRNYISGANTNHYFGEELAYDNLVSLSGTATYTTAQYGGNIAGMTWKSKGDGINRKYDFTYDAADRLLSAGFLQNTSGSAWDKSVLDFSVSGLSYDGNGNIGSMQQNGYLLGGSQAIDSLAYNYVGSGTTNRLLNVMDNSAYNSGSTPSTLGDFHYSGTKAAGATDYTYDNNGNTTTDANRLINHTSYYFNNQPDTISVTGKGTVLYMYDAAGQKLQKQILQTGDTVKYNGVAYPTNITTTYKYMEGFVYKTLTYTSANLAPLQDTDLLEFVNDEEGRVRYIPAVGSIPASFVFDYFIRDHSGSVRMGLTDESPKDNYPAATVETATYNGGTAEALESQYYQINTSDIVTTATNSRTSAWFSGDPGTTYVNANSGANNPDPYSNVTANSANVYWLNGETGDKTGLGITLKVMAGDQLSITGKSIWHSTGVTDSSYPITAALSTFLGIFGSTPVVAASTDGVITGAALNAASAVTTPLISLLTTSLNQTTNTTYAPKAGINWILFDNQFRPVAGGMGTDLVSSTPDVMNPQTKFVSGIPPMPQSGYVYIYCSNESNIDVYFDNLQVSLTHGPLLEETHYYPSGLAMAGISDKAWNKQPNNYHFEGNEIQHEEFNDGTGLEISDFNARAYDQQLAEWHTPDPIVNAPSPYTAMANNSPRYSDPDGKCPFCIVLIVAAIIGGGLDVWANKDNIHNFWQALGYFAAGAIAADAVVLSNGSATGLAQVASSWGTVGEAMSSFGTFAAEGTATAGTAVASFEGSFSPLAFAVGGTAQILADGSDVGFKNLDFGQYAGDFLQGGFNGMTAASITYFLGGIAGSSTYGAKVLSDTYTPSQTSTTPGGNKPWADVFKTIGKNFNLAQELGAVTRSGLNTLAGDLRNHTAGNFWSYAESAGLSVAETWGGASSAAGKLPAIQALPGQIWQYVQQAVPYLYPLIHQTPGMGSPGDDWP